MRPEDWGFPDFLTPEQIKSLDLFRQQCQTLKLFPADRPLADHHLLRFLRARQFDVAKSVAMLQADLEWRREFEGHVFKAAECTSIVDFCKHDMLYRAGSDKDDRPVLVMNLAQFFPREIKDANDIVSFWVPYVHRLTQECEKYGRTDYTIIADMQGFSPSQNFSFAIIKVIVNILQNFYPERLGYCFVLHLPAAFRMGWNLIAPLLDERTKAKLHLLGPKQLAMLLEYIPKDRLEKQFGGLHAPYPRPDLWVEELEGPGILVETGLFESSQDKLAPAQPRLPMRKKSGKVRQLLQVIRGGALTILPKEVPKPHPRAAVFGATGRTGVLVCKRLLDQGHDVAVFVRADGGGIPPVLLAHREKYGRDKLQFIVGSTLDDVDVDRAVETSDVVITCVSHEGSRPGHANEYEATFKSLLASLERNGTKRLVMVSSGNASEAMWEPEEDLVGNLSRNLLWASRYKHLANVEHAVLGSDLEWSVIRPGLLVDEPEGPVIVKENEYFVGGGRVSRQALAEFVVNVAVSSKFVRKAVAVSEGGAKPS